MCLFSIANLVHLAVFFYPINNILTTKLPVYDDFMNVFSPVRLAHDSLIGKHFFDSHALLDKDTYISEKIADKPLAFL